MHTAYGYDGRGNLTSQTVSGSNQVSSRTTSLGNIQDARYPDYSLNALGHQTDLGFDPRFGAADSVTDPNFRTASVAYDSFGRVVAQTSPDGVVTTTRYDFCGAVSCPNVGGITPVMRVQSDSPISPIERAYLDKLGRVIRTEVESFDGTFSRVDTEYDNQGRVDRVSQPYLAGQGRYFSSYGYDIRDRLTSVSQANGGSSTIQYDPDPGAGTGIKVTRTDAINKADGFLLETRQRVEIYNLTGEIVNSIDDATGKNVKTAYDYLGSGLPKSVVVDPDGEPVTTSFQFDDAGYRTALTGPDIGTITTKYTALGQVKESTDNAGNITTMVYDLLGRLETQSDPDDIASWSYDPTNGIGYLGSRSYGIAFSETLSYDSNARIDTVTTSLTGGGMTRSYTHSYDFDAYGRPDTITYPSGLTIRYGYNNQRGYLTSLTDTSTGTVLKTISATDAYGNVETESYGNGISTSRVFDPTTGWLEDIDTTKAGTVVQDNSYAWQTNGILESRVKRAGGTVYREAFNYDGLNRLTTSTTYVNTNTVASRTLSSTYDIRGNLETKTSSILADVDVTAYHVATNSNRLQSATIEGVSTSFAYDANGNITRYDRASGEDKFIAWNARNLPTAVVIGSSPGDTAPTARDEFAYGPDRARFYKRSEWDDNGTQRVAHTFYVGSYEELITDASDTVNAVVEKVRVDSNVVHLKRAQRNSTVVRSVEYLHRDHLGSIEAVTDASGSVIQSYGFDPFGGRRAVDWSRELTPAEKLDLVKSLDEPAPRGFTDHEMLDRTGLVHMNGRIYDAEIGRFLSPDPHVTYPTFSQSYNRYDYALNSPLTVTDPSGLDDVVRNQGQISELIDLYLIESGQDLHPYSETGGNFDPKGPAGWAGQTPAPEVSPANSRPTDTPPSFETDETDEPILERMGQVLSGYFKGVADDLAASGHYEASYVNYSTGTLGPSHADLCRCDVGRLFEPPETNLQQLGYDLKGSGAVVIALFTRGRSVPSKYDVGAYKDIRGTVAGLDAHHVGQSAVMARLIPEYNAATAPTILVPKVGHTIRGPNGVVSRSTAGFENARDVIARDIRELRRVYPDIPNGQLQQLIRMNRGMYPDAMSKP